MSNYELLINLCNQCNQSINNNGGACAESHNYLQDKLCELQAQFESLLKEMDNHNSDYPNE
jgi:hypothetical protein